ncbi:hypothetical protein [Raineyella sp.]|uniref:hypothetical protein n=1 Tax=Raineyella sp. TaxID=1911550 RepID=UPI002B215917|nr:hypothetical protein [Raineyella sp.]MEA5155583.1 hypothetical protein [Raineyella sp.]
MTNQWSNLPASDHYRAAADPHPFIPDVGGRGGNGLDPACPVCDRQDPAVQWKHATDCPRYLPHPASIAAAKIPTGGRLSIDDRFDHGPLRWLEVPDHQATAADAG